LHAKVDIDSLAWQGKKVTIEKISGHGYPEAQFAKFDINGSRAQLKNLSGRTVKVSDINITRAHVEISPDRLDRPKIRGAVALKEEAVVEAPKVPGFLERFVPDKVELGDIIIATASLKVKDEAGELIANVSDSSVQITPDLEKESAEIRIKKGKLEVKDAPDMSIIKTDLRWQDKSLFITESGVNIYDDGHIAAEGEINFNGEDPDFDVELVLSSIDVKEVVPEKWKDRISGTIRGPVTVKGSSENLVQKGTIHLDNGVIEGIKALQQIATFTKTDLFNRIVLNEAQSDFVKRGDNLELTNINLHSNSLFKIEGAINVNDDKLSGVVQLGVAPKTIRLVPGATEEVFTESRGGLVWTPVKIGGTTEKMTQDLTGRLIDAAIPGDIPGIAKTIGSLFGLGGDKEEEGEEAEEKTNGLKDLIENNVDEASDIGKALKRFGPLFNRN